MQEIVRRFGATARMTLLIAMLLAASGVPMRAQTFVTLYGFQTTAGPYAGLVQATDGNLYGTTVYAENGTGYYGSVFRISPAGKVTTIYRFCSQSRCEDGVTPYAALTQGSDGNFYGTTAYGGTSTACTGGCGTVFKITPAGVLTTLHSFDETDGYYLIAPLVQALNGNFYGTTSSGGEHNSGTVFTITPDGKLTTLHYFDALSEGVSPYAGLVQGTDGNLYGTTANGGIYGAGTVLKITPSGALTMLHSFDGTTEGAGPYAALIQATDGNFYGTTAGNSTNAGTIFRVTPGGTLTTLHTFQFSDGAYPYSGLVQATDRNFYGTTAYGGSGPFCFDECGTVFEMTPEGTLTTLHSFHDNDGFRPYGSLVQDTNGNLYGTTFDDGPGGHGTVFALSVGLGLFVETQPTSGAVGVAVRILGTNLTGATSVTFNGAPATFKVVSSSLISTTVPVGSTTGNVQVVTAGGTLSSIVPFRVTP